EISLTKRGTGTAVSESPRNPDVVWAGTDDGGVWVTKDGCKTWTNVSDKFKAAGLPGPRWVATIEASRFADSRCYVVFDAHRSIWVLDVTALRQTTPAVVRGKTALFSPSPAVAWQRANPIPFYSSHRVFNGQNPPRGAAVDYVLGKKAEKVSLVIRDVGGRTV